MTKVGIFGAGNVGSMVAFASAMGGTADEFIIYDIDEEKAASQARDIMDGVRFYPHEIQARAGDYGELADSDFIVVGSGPVVQPEDRLDELEDNKKATKEFAEEMEKRNFGGIIIVVTNPCDIIAYQVYRYSELPKNRVIGSGTFLDTSRFNAMLGEQLDISPDSVEGLVIGEHGNSQVIPWSRVHIGNMTFDEYCKAYPEETEGFDREEFADRVKNRASTIVSGKEYTQFGIGNTVTGIMKAVIHDTKEILPVGVYPEGEYGLEDVYLSLPAIVGRNGIEKIIELPLTEEETEKLSKSADVLKAHIRRYL